MIGYAAAAALNDGAGARLVSAGAIYFVVGLLHVHLCSLWFSTAGDSLILPRLSAWRKSEASPVPNHMTTLVLVSPTDSGPYCHSWK